MENKKPMHKIFSISLFLFLSLPFVSRAVEIPMGISPKEIVVEKYFLFDEPVEVDKLSDGTPGFLSIERGDGRTKNGDWTRIPIKGINFTLRFWNVGESGGESGFWLWKKNHADAKLTATYVVGGNGTIMSEGKGFMGQQTFTLEPATHEPDFDSVVFDMI